MQDANAKQHPGGQQNAAQMKKGKVAHRLKPAGTYFLLKSTVGGADICASFCTVKVGLTV